MANGKVDIQDLISEDFFVVLKSDFFEILKANIKKNNGTYAKFIHKNKLPKRILERFLYEQKAIRLDVLDKLLKENMLSWENVKKNVKELRGTLGGKILNPKFPFYFATKAGVRLMAAMLGDGCLDSYYRVHYANSNTYLIKGFLNDIQTIFGYDTKHNIRINPHGKNVYIVSLPTIYGRIISKVGLFPGRKVENNPEIPIFIFKLRKNLISEFLSQIFDDEGNVNLCSRHLKINFALLNSEKESKLMLGLEKLFLKLGILVSIYKQGVYQHVNREERRRWQLQIHGGMQIKKLSSILNLRSKNKRKKLNFLASSVKSVQYLRRNYIQIYLNCMKGVQNKKGYFTSEDLILPLKRKVGHIRNMLHKFLNKGLIYQIEAPKLDCFGAHPAKYVLNYENNK